MKSPVGRLLQQPMNRRQFLSYIGAVAITLVGIRGLLSAFRRDSQQGSGFGSSSYGGGDENRRQSRRKL